jgi:predicted glycoside hydrolase/deacetylase ChbG (UPF0249 family)
VTGARRGGRCSRVLRALGALAAALGLARAGAAADEKLQLALRVDDVGMSHAVNRGLADLLATKLPFSVSLMFACPWYQEAVELLQNQPQVSVGVHLTLNSEWKHYNWGPLLGGSAVPSLVDAEGLFLPSTAALVERGFALEEVERELGAQIERALRSGLRIDYVDHHMGTAVATPALRALLEKLAAKYQLGISRYFGEAYNTLFSVPVTEKRERFLQIVSALEPARANLVVIHAARPDPEIEVLVDLNNAGMNTVEGAPLVSRHRQAELEMLTSGEIVDLLRSGRFELVTYRDIIGARGLSSMLRPAGS